MSGAERAGVPRADPRGADRLARARPRVDHHHGHASGSGSTRRTPRGGSSATARARAGRRRSCSAPRSGRWPRGASTSASRICKALAAPALRHRVILNFEGEAEGIDIDTLVGQIVAERRGGARSRAKRPFSDEPGGAHDRRRRRSKRLVARVAGQVRRRRAEHYALRGAFWWSIAAVVVLLLKTPLAGWALPLAGGLFVAGTLGGLAVGRAQAHAVAGCRAAGRPGVGSGGPRRHGARVGGPPRPHAAGRCADQRRHRAGRQAGAARPARA